MLRVEVHFFLNSCVTPVGGGLMGALCLQNTVEAKQTFDEI